MGKFINQKAFQKTLSKIGALKRTLPLVIAKTTENHFKDNFEKQGFDDSTVDPWKEVQRRTPDSKAYKYAKSAARSRAILIGRGSGALKRSIKATKVSFLETRISTDREYAKFHNEGSGRIPQRKFIGNSQSLNRKLKKHIVDAVKSAFR